MQQLKAKGWRNPIRKNSRKVKTGDNDYKLQLSVEIQRNTLVHKDRNTTELV